MIPNIFFNVVLTQTKLMLDVHIIVGLCVDQLLPSVNYAFPQTTHLRSFARELCAAHIHIWCQYWTSQMF